MNKTLKRLAVVAGAAIPAAAMLVTSASAAVSPYSKVHNGDFANGTMHWYANPHPLPDATLQHGLGMLKLTNSEPAKAATKAYAHQCIEVDGGVKYELSGKIYLTSAQVREGKANMGIQFFENTNCTGAKAGSAYTPVISDENAWKKVSVTPTAGKKAKSARVMLIVQKDGTAVEADKTKGFFAYFDDVQVLAKSIKIPDGPIIVNPQPTPPPHPPQPPQGPDDVEAPQDSPDPDPSPSPEAQPEPQPEDPQDEQPQDEPADEPADEEPTVEDVPGPEVPDEPVDDAPAGDGDESSDAPAGGSEDDGEGSEDEETEGSESDVQDLEGEESEGAKPSKQPKGDSQPTPQAPATGNVGNEDGGLLGGTELGLMLAGAAGVMGIAFIAAARNRRKQHEDVVIGE